MAVRDFDGETGICSHRLYPFPHEFSVAPIAQDDAITQFGEKGSPEGKEFVKVEDPRNPDTRGINGKILFSRIGGKQQPLSLGEEIRKIAALTPFHHIVFFAPAAIKEGFFFFDADLSNETEILAPFAFKGSDLIFSLAQIEALEPALLPGPLLHRQQGYTNGTGHIVMRGHRDGFPKDPLESGHNTLVEGGAALEKNPVSDPAVPHDPVEVILYDRVTETRHKLLG